MCRSTDDGWMQREVERVDHDAAGVELLADGAVGQDHRRDVSAGPPTAPRVAPRPRRPAQERRRSRPARVGAACSGGGDPLLGRRVPLDPLAVDLVPLRLVVGTVVRLGLALGPLAVDRHPPDALVELLVDVPDERRVRAVFPDGHGGECSEMGRWTRWGPCTPPAPFEALGELGGQPTRHPDRAAAIGSDQSIRGDDDGNSGRRLHGPSEQGVRADHVAGRDGRHVRRDRRLRRAGRRRRRARAGRCGTSSATWSTPPRATSPTSRSPATAARRTSRSGWPAWRCGPTKRARAFRASRATR